jgi:Zn-dependent protease with chaperone function
LYWAIMSDQKYSIASCENCGGHIEFPAEGAGMRVQCPHCAVETNLIAEPSTFSQAQGQITAAELKAAFDGIVPRSRIPIFYQAGLLLVALFMIVLPGAYLAFATFCGYCVYWYAVHALAIFSGASGGMYLIILKVVLYVGPIIGGVIAVFFMFKPILARTPKRAEPVELNPAQHPRLFQFIAHLSDLLYVSMPKRIYLDCEVGASAGFRGGWLSLLGNDLVLTLGLPLVAGLNTRQLAAVVAHELGHCTQALAMRLGYVIDRINRWFFRVVYERDTWDDSFEEWANSVDDWRLSLIVACARLAVWLSRKVLALLMLTGHAASCFLSRQMEFHADACAVSVVGSAGMESLLLRLREQVLLERLAYDGLQHFWQTRHQLPNSLPDFLGQLEERLPREFHDQSRLTLLNETVGLFATHPTAAQRIQKARQRATEGIFVLERPARWLFNDFGATSQLVTGRHYRENLRLAVTGPMLKPADDLFKDQKRNAPVGLSSGQ